MPLEAVSNPALMLVLTTIKRHEVRCRHLGHPFKHALFSNLCLSSATLWQKLNTWCPWTYQAGVMLVNTQGVGSLSRCSSMLYQPIPNPSPLRLPEQLANFQAQGAQVSCRETVACS